MSGLVALTRFFKIEPFPFIGLNRIGNPLTGLHTSRPFSPPLYRRLHLHNSYLLVKPILDVAHAHHFTLEPIIGI